MENQPAPGQNIAPRSSKKTIILAIVVLLGALVFSFAYETFLPHASGNETKNVVIPQGYGSRRIGELLKNEGVIRSKWAFVTYVSLRGEASYLKPGTYKFFNSSIAQISRDLVAGETKEISITIPEGWNIDNIASLLEKEKLFPAKDFVASTGALSLALYMPEFPVLADHPKNTGLEGYLFPDTYRVYKDAGPADVVKRMLANFDRKLTPELRQEVLRQGKTIFEIVTMASIIEEEVRSDEDRAVVSGILWKRIGAGIPLQVDATVLYAKNQKTKYADFSIVTAADKKIDSPYNTYKYRGLPRGPIANPGLSSIRAAIYPKPSPFLYYLSTPEGKTIFSSTLEEHNAAKAKYLR